jgi:hypothetical protein
MEHTKSWNSDSEFWMVTTEMRLTWLKNQDVLAMSRLHRLEADFQPKFQLSWRSQAEDSGTQAYAVCTGGLLAIKAS